MKVNALPAVDALLQHPQQSRLLWHDLVKYSAIERAYIDNLYHGVYGTLSRSVRESLGELEVVVALQSLWVENMSTLAKIEVTGINSVPTDVSIEQIWHQAVSLVEPILRHQHVTLSVDYKKGQAHLDERYYMLALRNVLVIASHLAIPKSLIHARLLNGVRVRTLRLQGVTSVVGPWPKQWIDMATDTAPEPWNRIWYFGHMTSIVAKRWGGSCVFKKTGNKFDLSLTM